MTASCLSFILSHKIVTQTKNKNTIFFYFPLYATYVDNIWPSSGDVHKSGKSRL
jgi:hypothetical protein